MDDCGRPANALEEKDDERRGGVGREGAGRRYQARQGRASAARDVRADVVGASGRGRARRERDREIVGEGEEDRKRRSKQDDVDHAEDTACLK